MTDNRCPDCGAPISAGAVVCPQCGFPLRPDALATGLGSPGGGSSGRGVVVVLIGGALFLVFVIAILAAITIPRFTNASARAKERQGVALLRWAYVAEQKYYAENGRYTDQPGVLGSPPALSSAGPERYTLQISAADDRFLCLEAVPKPEEHIAALSMDENGLTFHAAGCSGRPSLGED